MNAPANAGDDFEKRLHRGAVLRLTLDKATLDDPDIDTRSKYVIVVSALLPDEDVWFIICTSKTDHFDKNPKFADDILRWAPGEYSWCKSAVTVVNCTTVDKLPTTKLKQLYANGQLAFVGDLRPAHLERLTQSFRRQFFCHRKINVGWSRGECGDHSARLIRIP